MARVNFSQIIHIYFSGFCIGEEVKGKIKTNKLERLAKRCAIKAARMEKNCELPLMSSKVPFMINDISCEFDEKVKKAECEFYLFQF